MKTAVRKSSARRAVLVANRHPRLRLDRRALARAIHTLDAEFQVLPADTKYLVGPRNRAARHSASLLHPFPSSIGPGELSLVFLTDPALARLHADFLDDPSATDVITFEGDPAHGSAGEVCVSVDTAAAYARKHRRDFSAELLLYVVHGWLHLAGYDDLRPARKRVMRRAEARAMRLLTGLPPVFRLPR